MMIDYLTWFKNLDLDLEKRPDAHLLLVSSVYEPTEMLQNHLVRYAQADLPNALKRTDSWGYEPLIDAIAERRSCNRGQIVPTNGASSAIYLVCRALLNPGDHVVVEWPGYEPLMAAPDLIGCSVTKLLRRLPCGTIELSDVRKAVRSNTKLLILSNLHNPTGARLADGDLRSIADAARSISKSVKIVVDEIYLDFAGARRTTASNLGAEFVSIDSLTKVYGLGAIHCGWIVADAPTTEAIQKLYVIVEGSGAKVLAGFSASIVMDLDRYLERSLRIVTGNRVILAETMAPLMEDQLLEGSIPANGCICFMRVPGVSDTTNLCAELARKHEVHTVPGKFFGEPGYIRIGFGSRRERLAAALDRFAHGLRSLVPTMR